LTGIPVSATLITGVCPRIGLGGTRSAFVSV